MALMVVLAGISVLATFGSARSGHLVFCRMVDGDVVVGVTTDCSEVTDGVTTEGVTIADPSGSSPDAVVAASRKLVSPLDGSALRVDG